MKLLTIAVHQIDRGAKQVIPVALTEDAADLENYVKLLVDRILGAKGRRRYRFERPTCEVPLLLKQAYEDGSWSDIGTSLADRLLRVELTVEGQYGHLPDIPRGSLIQCAIEYEQGPAYLMAKVEHDQFLDQTQLIRRLGLPYDKQALKTCLVDVDGAGKPGKTWVSDSSSRIARYWWQGFLELEEEYTDEANTQRAFLSIDRLLAKKLKRVARSDYTFLRNTLVGYFRTQPEFNIDAVVEHVYGTYEPENKEEVDLDALRGATEALVDKGLFDERFTLVPKEIKARIRRVIPLTDEIDLALKTEIPNLRDVIKARQHPDGMKYLEIRTERGWEEFKTAEEEE